MFSIRKRKKTALLLTGAAARISQETAILDGLMEQKRFKMKENQMFLAGFSSGSLNILALNACFRKRKSLDWNRDFKEKVLFPVTTGDIYLTRTPLPYDTRPLRWLLKSFLNAAGYDRLGDYSFPSRVLIFSDRKLKTYWPYSLDPGSQKIPLLDLHMSSTAIPVVFPWQKIQGSREWLHLPDGHFQDGGTQGIFQGFEEVLKKQIDNDGSFKEIYIISPMRFDDREDHGLLINNIRLELGEEALKNFLRFLGDISQKMFLQFLQNLFKFNLKNKLAGRIYVCIPAMKKNFPFILFNYQRQQHEAVLSWIHKNPERLAIPLEQYLAENIKDQDLS